MHPPQTRRTSDPVRQQERRECNVRIAKGIAGFFAAVHVLEFNFRKASAKCIDLVRWDAPSLYRPLNVDQDAQGQRRIPSGFRDLDGKIANTVALTELELMRCSGRYHEHVVSPGELLVRLIPVRKTSPC